jgi:sulfoxide reductase catalytic subunit YedY
LTLAEATNELAFLVTGMYDEPLLKQHGAPIRVVVPWKYGFKSAKAIVRIELTDRQPATFWNTVVPNEYDFNANVNPNVPHPRWSQKTETMLGTDEPFPTVIYNGYGDWVAKLYS